MFSVLFKKHCVVIFFRDRDPDVFPVTHREISTIYTLKHTSEQRDTQSQTETHMTSQNHIQPSSRHRFRIIQQTNRGQKTQKA